MRAILKKERLTLLIFLLLCLLGLETVHQRFLTRYHEVEDNKTRITQRIQSQAQVQAMLKKYEKTVQELLGVDYENVWDRGKMTRFLKKIAYQNKLQNFRVLFLKEKVIHESAQFMIKCFSIRVQWLCSLDDHFFAFLKTLQETGPGYVWSSEVLIEKCADDEEDSLRYQKEIGFLKGVYFFDWYTIVLR